MKNKNSKQLYKLVSLLLVIVLLCQFPLNTIAIGDNETEITSVSETPVLEETVDNEVIPLVSAAEVPNFISQAQIEEHGHISRLSDEETLNTLVYLNRDGTKTKYIMDYPVKYVDENGDTKFVDLSLSETTTAFETTANDIVLSVSKDYTKGITLTYNDYAVSLVAMPGNKTVVSGGISTAPIVMATKNNNAVTYNDVFGTDIDMRYSPLHNGVKEDIILQAYNGTNTFDFLLSTSGLGVYSEKDNYYLAEAANADMRMDLGKVIVYDANRKMSEGSLTVTTLKENQLYQITVSVDQAFLTDPNTVYPVQVDPSITVSDTTHGANAVIDCPVYSGKQTVNMGTALYNHIGYIDSAYQTGRTAVKLVGLINDTTYQGLHRDAIQSAYFYIKDSSGTATKQINIYALTSNSTWTETSLTWSTVGTVSSTLQASANVGGEAWSSFDITNLIKEWKSGNLNPNCGFILQSTNESLAGNFFSSESAEANWPYLALTYVYGSGGGDSFLTAEEVVWGDAFIYAYPVVKNEKRYYWIRPTETCTYLFTSIPGEGDPKIWLYNENQTLIGSNDDGAGNLQFRFEATLNANAKYYIVLGHSGSSTGLFGLSIYKNANIANGTYYFKSGNGMYLDIHGPVAQELLHQWQFSYGSQQKWSLSKLTDGYYTIRALYGDQKYVAISNSNLNSNNIVLQSSVTDAAKWRIFTTSNESFYLEPKNAPGKILYCPNNVLGTELQLIWISSDYQGSTAWNPICCNYDYSVQHYYDQGYNVRYPGAATAIADYQRICSEILLDVFGISMTVNGIQNYTSSADTCTGTPVTIEDTTTACSCGWGTNHKKIDLMLLNLVLNYGEGSNILSKFAWIGHDLDTTRSASYTEANCVIMVSSGVNRIRNICTLLHETSHEIGAPDHYCEGDIDSTGKCSNSTCWSCYRGKTPPACIMTSGYNAGIESVVSYGMASELYCSECLSNTNANGIFTHLINHH